MLIAILVQEKKHKTDFQDGSQGGHLGFFYQNDFSYFWSSSCPDTSYQVSSQLAFWFWRWSTNRFSRLLSSWISDWNNFIYSRLSLSRTRLSRIIAYLEVKSGPCFNTEIYQQAIKYCGKEEKLLLRSNFSSFPQYFQYISCLGVKLHVHSVKGGCSIICFPQFRKSDMSKYGYLEVFPRVPWSSR